jgi:hypothetical protein
MKNNLYLQAVLLIAFIIINIIPGGCFSWGRGPVSSAPSLPPPQFVPEPPNTEISVNGDAYIKALECVKSHPKANDQDKTGASGLEEKVKALLSASKDGKVSVNKTDIDTYSNIFPDCNFSALI